MTDMEDAPAPLVHEIVEDDVVKGPATLAEQLKIKREQIAETHDAFFPLTGYEEYGVEVRHRLMDRPEIERIARRIMSETRDRGERNMRILLDMILNSTSGFFLKGDEPEDHRQILDDRRGEIPVMSWSMFAEYLGWQPGENGDSDARAALYFVFGGNEFMIGQYGILLNRWMNNTGLKVDQEFLGEAL